MESTRLARPHLLPRQTKLPLHNGWRWTRKKCHWPWNLKSTIRKAKPRKHNTKLDCIRNTGRYLQLCSFTFLHCTIFTLLRTVLDHGRWCRLCVEIWSRHGPNKMAQLQLGRTDSRPCQYNFLYNRFWEQWFEKLSFSSSEVLAATNPECDPTASSSSPLRSFIRYHYSKDSWKYLDFMMPLSGEGSRIRAAPLHSSLDHWNVHSWLPHFWSQI